MLNNKIYYDSLLRVVNSIEIDNKSILITGASGLIGSCMIDLFMLANERGKSNHIFAMGRSLNKLQERFSYCVKSEYFNIIEQDVCCSIDDEFEFDYIVHGASNADPVSYAKYPAETMATNLIGGYNILEYGRKHTPCKITMLSTFEVYGNTGVDVYKESDAGIIDFNTLRSCYPESKRSVEILSRCYAAEYCLPVNVARLSSIYGPTMLKNDSKAHAQFISHAIEGKDIVLKSKGLQRRTYCYVIDAVTGILRILFHGIAGECYNVCNENAVASISEVAHIVARIAGTNVVFDLPSEIEAKGFSKPQNCILNNDKLKKLGWSGHYDVERGLLETISILKLSK